MAGVIANVWRSAMTQADFMSADVACVNGQWNQIGQYIVPAGSIVGLGYGDLHGQQDANGRIFADLRDSSTAPGVAINGYLQFAYYDASDHPIKIVQEYRTDVLRQNSTDRTKQITFPVDTDAVSRDKKVKIFFKPDGTSGTTTVSKTNSSLLMDVTRGVGA